jgi:hypothetical protein
MNTFCSIQSLIVYKPPPVGSPLPPANPPEIQFAFENNYTNTGTDGGTATNDNTNITFDSANYKTGLYSIKAVQSTSNTANVLKYPSSGNYNLSFSTTGCTVSFWVRFSVQTIPSGSYPCLFVYNPGGNARFLIGFTPSGTNINQMYFTCGINSGGGQNYLFINKSTLQASPYNMSFTGGWNHVGFSVNASGNWIVTINGEQCTGAAQTTNLSSMNSASPIYIGKEGTAQPVQWSGNIDDFRLYKTGLSLLQLKYLYQNPGV